MTSPPEDPPYVPAPHLITTLLHTGNPLLTASALVSLFEDFRHSLRYVSTAPELVFERLVANVLKDINATLQLDIYREQNREYEGDSSTLQRCQSSKGKLEKELEELKLTISTTNKGPCTCANSNLPDISSHGESQQPATPLPSQRQQTGTLPRPENPQTAVSDPTTAIERRTRKNPSIGNIHTRELQVRCNHTGKPFKTVPFAMPYPTPPGIPMGLTELNICNCKGVSVKTYASEIQRGGFEAYISTWDDKVLFGGGCTWLEVEADDPDIQYGRYDARRLLFPYLSDHSQNIIFPRAYATPPVVVVWLVGFDMGVANSCRIRAFATDITEVGFTIHIGTWENACMNSGTASWVAYTTGRPGICSGSFDTRDICPCNPPQENNSGYVKFERNVFSAPPRTMVAINSLDMDCNHFLRLKAKTSSVTAEGMNWHLDSWADSILYSAGASYIALS